MIRSAAFRTSAARVTLLLIASACALNLIACKKTADEDVLALVSVEAVHPETGEISEHVIADATLSPLAQAVLSSKLSAPVKTFYVQRGSKVKAGQLLAVLENSDLAAQALDNKGQYQSAQASYEMQTRAQLPEEYAKAELEVEQAKAQLHLEGEIADARQKLFKQGAIPGRDYDTAVAQLAQAQAAYDTARNHLASLQNVSKQASIQQAEGQLSSAKGKYQAAEAQISYSEIRSPIAGVVTDRPLFPGEMATPGAALITVMDTSALLAKVHLAQTAAQRLSVGDDATLSVPGVETPVPAKVSLISPALDPGSTTVEVWLRVDNAHSQYKAGTPVRASMVGRTVKRAVKIPLSAIFTAQDGSQSVMVVNGDGTALKVAVQTGINDGDDVEIVKGLNGSERVITAGAYGLDERTRVRIGKPEAGGDDK